jgi:hypothetical protein
MDKEILLDGQYIIPFDSAEDEIEYIEDVSDKQVLYDHEVSRMAAEIRDALRTTNGDTGPINMSARQVAILLKFYLSFIKPKEIKDIPWRENHV